MSRSTPKIDAVVEPQSIFTAVHFSYRKRSQYEEGAMRRDMTIPEPRLEYRNAQPYVAIRGRVAIKELGIVLPPLNSEVLPWLQKQGMKPAGAPFWRYLLFDMGEKLEINVAFPVGVLLRGDERIVADVLPAGTHATTLYVGYPDGLMQATADLLSWAAA
jgi:effector-binding domain-containing protein